MNAISNLARDLRDTSAQISHIEHEIAAHPSELGLHINLRSLQKRMDALEARFAELTRANFLEVVDYRVNSESHDSGYPVSAVGAVLTSFQNMVAAFFDALTTGPKVRARISPETWAKANLQFAYTFDGSLGFAMTVPSERLLFGSPMETAIERAFQVLNARNTSDIASLASQVGVASIRSVYALAKVHSRANLSAKIEWKNGKEVLNSTELGVDQLTLVTELIEATSDTSKEDVVLPGMLVGIDQALRTFHLELPQGESIKGKLGEAFEFSQSVPIPVSVTAKLSKQTRVHYSTEKEDIDWELLSYE